MKSGVVLFAVASLAIACDRGKKTEDVPKVLPTADEVLEAHVTAMGGREAWAKVDAERVTGEVTIEKADVHISMTMIQKRPNLAYSRMEVKGMGVKEEGCDGTTCWEKSDAEGVRILSGEELEDKKRDAILDSDLRWKELYTKVEMAGAVDFEGHPAWKILLTPPSGPVETEFYDRKTHLQLGDDKITRDQSGESPTKSVISEWKAFGAVKQPTRIVATTEGMTIRITVKDIEINPTLPANQFELPPEVRALRDQAAEATP